jgi:hypothetical protein
MRNGSFKGSRFFPPRHATLSNQQHSWDFDISPAAATFGTLGAQQNLSVQLARLLVETGIAVTPAANPLTDFRAGFAVVRYSEYFRAAQNAAIHPLAINNDPALRSSRLKQLMAEELASGVACYLLREYLDVVHIVDYQVWRNLTNQRAVGRHPDYYCITSTGESLLVEVKGSISARRTPMTKPRARARVQLNNGVFGAEPVRAAGSRFSIATNLLIQGGANPRSISYIEQIVPPVVRAGTNPATNPGAAPFGDPAALSYCKILRYVGLDDEAERLLKGAPIRFDDPTFFEGNDEVIYDSSFTVLGIDPFANVILLQTDVLNDLNEGKKPKLPKQELKGKRSASNRPKEKAMLALNDAVIVCPNPELLGARSNS